MQPVGNKASSGRPRAVGKNFSPQTGIARAPARLHCEPGGHPLDWNFFEPVVLEPEAWHGGETQTRPATFQQLRSDPEGRRPECSGP